MIDPDNAAAAAKPAAPAAPMAPTSLRARVAGLVQAEWFRNAILGVIVFNAIVLGLDTDRGMHERFGSVLEYLDRIITAVFVIEIGLRLYAEGRSFFKSGWNIFDFVIVAASVPLAASDINVLRIFRILRIIRVLRVFRLFGVVSAMRRVVDALFAAVPGISAIIMVLALLFYVFAVMTTDLFGAESPEMFGSIGASIFTLFQIMTGDGWSEVVREVMAPHPWAWAFFIPFIVITSFAVLNLFIAVIVEALQKEQQETYEEARKEMEDEIADDLEDIEAEQVVARRERAEILTAIEALRADIRALGERKGEG